MTTSDFVAPSPGPIISVMEHVFINTPNGAIGSKLVRALLERGVKVSVTSLSDSTEPDSGLRVTNASFEDEQALRSALDGCFAMFWLTPTVFMPGYDQWAQTCARKAVDAARDAGVKRAVVQSSMGVQNGPKTGFVHPLGDVENIFNDALPDVVSLRAGYLMENLLRDVPTIAAQGAIFSPLPPDKTFPMVATRDVADRAASWVVDRAWSGHRVVGVHGPEDLSYPAIAAAIAQVTGRSVSHIPISVEDAEAGMRGAGLPEAGVELAAELFRGALAGKMDPAEPRTAETTTPTSILEFAKTVLLPAIEGMQS